MGDSGWKGRTIRVMFMKSGSDGNDTPNAAPNARDSWRYFRGDGRGKWLARKPIRSQIHRSHPPEISNHMALIVPFTFAAMLCTLARMVLLEG